MRIAYAIGKSEPYEVTVDTFGSKADNILDDFITKFDMKPRVIIERLGLIDVNYKKDGMFSHFGHSDRNWEKVEDI